MILKEGKLSQERVQQIMDLLMQFSEYEDFQIEVQFLYKLWLDRTMRFSDVETNKSSLDDTEMEIAFFKNHLDEVYQDISYFQLKEID